jgi:Rhs element Vgr protein
MTTERSDSLVTFNVLVNGEELDSTIQLLSIAVEKEINRIPWAKITILDGEPSTEDFEHSNEESFFPGNEIEIKAGYDSNNETIFKGVVICHSLKIRSSGSVFVVECRDLAIKLTVGRKNKYFKDSKDSDILEEIISEYGLEKEIETSGEDHAEMVQYNVSDWDFCIARSQANGKVCVVDDGKISVLAPNYSQHEKHTLVYGESIYDLDAEIDARNQVRNVSSYGWDAASQEVLEIEANIPEVVSNGNITTADLASVIGVEKVELKEGSAISDAGLQIWANAKSLFNQLSKTRGRVRFQGVHDVKPNTTLGLSGVGNRFNGKVYVSAVRHIIADGEWTCDAQFGINPKWFTESVDINPLPASGLMAAVNGLQIAKVTQLEADPKGEERIMVRMPIIHPNAEGIWARVATLDAGNNRGTFFRPEIGDEVIVGFLNDNPNNPIVLGMLNSSAKPAPIVASDDNHEKGFVTREQLKFLFDDKKKSITIETPNGNKITLNDDEGGVTVEDENSNVVTLNSDGMTLESTNDISIKTSGDVTIEGTNVEITASANLKAEASGMTEIKGSPVNIN